MVAVWKSSSSCLDRAYTDDMVRIAQNRDAALHERMGFDKVAYLQEVGRKFDDWIDVGYWQRILG